MTDLRRTPTRRTAHRALAVATGGLLLAVGLPGTAAIAGGGPHGGGHSGGKGCEHRPTTPTTSCWAV